MLRLAKVVNVNPQAHSADVVFMDTGDRASNVQVLSGNISTTSGKLGLHVPTSPTQPYGVQNTGGRDVFAWVAFAGRIPVILGFKIPEIGQMTFAEPNLEVDRHPSDVYSTTSADGSFEKAWPNGLWLGVQTNPGHVDRTGTDYDGEWKITQNTGASYTVTLALPGGVGKIVIDPEGNATLTLASLTIDSNTTINGTLAVSDGITTPQDVVAGAISLKTHKTTLVASGTGVSGPPE